MFVLVYFQGISVITQYYKPLLICSPAWAYLLSYVAKQSNPLQIDHFLLSFAISQFLYEYMNSLYLALVT